MGEERDGGGWRDGRREGVREEDYEWGWRVNGNGGQ